MALSDYERRVLDEIESDLAGLGAGRRTRLRATFAVLRMTILWVLVPIAGITVTAIFAPGWLAAPAGAVAGAIAGFAISSCWRRRGRTAAH